MLVADAKKTVGNTPVFTSDLNVLKQVLYESSYVKNYSSYI